MSGTRKQPASPKGAGSREKLMPTSRRRSARAARHSPGFERFRPDWNQLVKSPATRRLATAAVRHANSTFSRVTQAPVPCRPADRLLIEAAFDVDRHRSTVSRPSQLRPPHRQRLLRLNDLLSLAAGFLVPFGVSTSLSTAPLAQQRPNTLSPGAMPPSKSDPQASRHLCPRVHPGRRDRSDLDVYLANGPSRITTMRAPPARSTSTTSAELEWQQCRGVPPLHHPHPRHGSRVLIKSRSPTPRPFRAPTPCSASL